MRYQALMAIAAVSLLAAGPASAMGYQESVPATPRPIPAVSENAPPAAFLAAARDALTAGRNDEAAEALERAESRILSRDVTPSRANLPSGQSLIHLIDDARAALAAGDKTRTLSLINQATPRQPAVAG